MTAKPTMSFWQIWNMCFGFLGIQFGFALQNANVSRIFQTLGASIEQIPLLWIAAPMTGLIVQPIIGHCSDRTWTRLGRRRPYFLWGALLAGAALLLMPNAPALWIAGGLLWILDASINVSMEPFRAFVADQLPSSQRARGYAMQSFFIGIGAVVASLLPWLLAKAGVANTATPGAVPATVHYAFYLGAAALVGAVLWTVTRTREYPPEQLEAFAQAQPAPPRAAAAPKAREAWPWLAAGGGLAAWIALAQLAPELYLLAGGLLAYGLALLVLARVRRGNAFTQIMTDLHAMPEAMRRLAVVQFFSWFALFAMWIYTTAAVTEVHFGSSDTASAAYNAGANWVGVLFAAYNGFAALAAIAIPRMVARIGLRLSHLVNLWIGAAGLLSFLFIRDPDWLLASMLGVGFAWASILSLPYALLADSLPARKMGVYMGIFNFFIVIPQLLAASVLGVLLKALFHGRPIGALLVGGVSWLIAGLCVLRVAEPGLRRAPAGLASQEPRA
ncbi:transporter [Mizugakiibacter sediminis]|uniref:Transporter n=1 Tax=Mizugakiibacter sediminis TaxID=1475481 RepID=A0A0K8QL26_9GAMM|nr:MFS transporter [Mizugakiibacter sediminis]GAP65583.1 transporter [Mizugakiibacter sediminis]